MMRSLFTNIIIQEFSKGGINMYERIKASSIMQNYVNEVDKIGIMAENEFIEEEDLEMSDLLSLAQITKKVKLHSTEEF